MPDPRSQQGVASRGTRDLPANTQELGDEDTFGDALDAMTLGMTRPGDGDDPLATFAAAIQGIGSIPTEGDESVLTPGIDRSTRRQIWTDLMREAGTSPARGKTTQRNGPAGSMLSLNPWAAQDPPPPKPRRSRPAPGVLRFIPAAQPTSSFLLIIAVLFLVGSTFASLAPDGGQGVDPTSPASEEPAQLAFASPAATPISGTCDPKSGWVGHAGLGPNEYEPSGTIDIGALPGISDTVATFSACMDGPDWDGLDAVTTDRYVDELRLSLDGAPPDLNDRFDALQPYWHIPLEADNEVWPFVWAGSRDVPGDRLNVLPQTARLLSDGRIGLIATITQESLSPVPDDSWITPEAEVEPLIVLIGLVPTDNGVLIDELFGLCNGSRCISMFGPDAANPDATPITGTCDPAGQEFSIDPDTPYAYAPKSGIASRSVDALGEFFATFSACMAGPQLAEMSRISTVRFMDGLRTGLNGTETESHVLEVEERIAAMSGHWTFSIAGQQDIQSFTWEGSGGGEEPMSFHVFPGTARMLADGRVGVMTSIAPAGVSPVPDQSWIEQEVPGTYAVFFIGLGSVGTIFVDEMIGHCGGADCVPLYGADAEPQPAPPASEGSVPVNIRIEAANVNATVSELDRFTDLFPLPGPRLSAGWFMDTAAAGGPGNMVLTGYIDGSPEGVANVRNLESLPVGSLIEITGEDGKPYIYELDSDTAMLSSNDPATSTAIAGLLNSPSTSGESTLSLIAFGGAQDEETGEFPYVVLARARLVESSSSATPVASPLADVCNVAPITKSGAPLLTRMYRHTSGSAGDLKEIKVTRQWEQIVACSGVPSDGSGIPEALVTNRFANDPDPSSSWILTEPEAEAILGFPLAWNELNEMQERYEAAMAANPGYEGDLLSIDTDLGVMRHLGDDRIAFYSAEYWLVNDGRIEPRLGTQAGSRAVIHIFAQQGQQWLYDETVEICVGPCEGFVESGAPKPPLTGTPVAEEDKPWLSPLMEPVCTVREADATPAASTSPSLETDPSDYVPFGAADPDDQTSAANTYHRLTSGCEPTDNNPLIRDESMAILGLPGEPGTTQAQIDTAMAISQQLSFSDPIEIALLGEPDPSPSTEVAAPDFVGGKVMLPGDIVTLPDGRLGGFTRDLVVPIKPGLYPVFEQTVTLFYVFAPEGNGWIVDEVFAICIGNCAEYWAQGSSPEAAPASSPEVSPAAASQDLQPISAESTPLATPKAAFDYLQPVTADDCAVDSRPLDQIRSMQETLGPQVPRSYLPVIAAEGDLAVEIVQASRTWYACSAYGMASQRMAMESQRTIFEGGPNEDTIDSPAFAAQDTAIEELTAQVIESGWQEYFVETEEFGNFADDSADMYLQDRRSVMLPEHVFRLPDGRMAGVVTELVPVGYLDVTAGYPDRTVRFQIFTQDSAQGGRWVLDETLWLCVNGCDESASPAASPSSEETIASQDRSSVATPESSPAAATPDSADICTGQQAGLSDDELREMSLDDWLFPSYYSAGVAEPDVAQAIRDTYLAYWQCLYMSSDPEHPDAGVIDEANSFLSDRNRYTLLYDDLDAEQPTDLDEFTCLDPAVHLLDHYPLPINTVSHHISIPITNPPSPDWENPLEDVPVHVLGDGRYGMMLGGISLEALQDLAQRGESDWLTFVAFVEIDGVFYIDEEVTVIAPTWDEGNAPVMADGSTPTPPGDACTGQG